MEGANMSTIDRQRVAAVRRLEAMGYVFRGQLWMGLAVPRLSKPMRCTRCSSCALMRLEFAMISEALESYEAKRWPEGKMVGGKGEDRRRPSIFAGTECGTA
jgi:hypothetical protein